MNYKDLVNLYGNGNRAALALGMHRQTVHKWKTSGIPFVQQFRIQMKTKGKLKAGMPDMNPRRKAA